jgi:hypothetical protein
MMKKWKSERVEEWTSGRVEEGMVMFFFRPFGAEKMRILFPGAYAPGYALFRPFGPDKEKNPPILHRGLVKEKNPPIPAYAGTCFTSGAGKESVWSVKAICE